LPSRHAIFPGSGSIRGQPSERPKANPVHGPPGTARGAGVNLTPTVIREWTQEHMTVLSFRGIRIDWLKPVLPAYLHILDRATEEPWFKQPIRLQASG
jgi:hypothetical protein